MFVPPHYIIHIHSAQYGFGELVEFLYSKSLKLAKQVAGEPNYNTEALDSCYELLKLDQNPSATCCIAT